MITSSQILSRLAWAFLVVAGCQAPSEASVPPGSQDVADGAGPDEYVISHLWRTQTRARGSHHQIELKKSGGRTRLVWRKYDSLKGNLDEVKYGYATFNRDARTIEFDPELFVA